MWNAISPGFELVSPCPIPATITITPRIPFYVISFLPNRYWLTCESTFGSSFSRYALGCCLYMGGKWSFQICLSEYVFQIFLVECQTCFFQKSSFFVYWLLISQLASENQSYRDSLPVWLLFLRRLRWIFAKKIPWLEDTPSKVFFFL